MTATRYPEVTQHYLKPSIKTSNETNAIVIDDDWEPSHASSNYGKPQSLIFVAIIFQQYFIALQNSRFIFKAV